MILKIKQFFAWISSPKILTTINLVLVVLMVSGNSYIQIFCQPSPLAWCLLIPFLIITVAQPRLKSLNFFSSFSLAITLCFWVYCIIFLGHFNLYAFITVPFLVGILGIAPVLFSLQILKKLIQKRSRVNFLGFAFAMVTCFATCLYSYSAYSSHSEKLKNLNIAKGKSVEENYWNERIVGMHFIYHTEVCEYDGWRPPLHDPFLNIGIRLNKFQDPLQKLSLEERIELYKLSFPDRSIHQKRACACVESDAYHSFFKP